MAVDDRAIVVGISHYPGLTSSALAGAENDAQAFYAWLRSPSEGNVPEDNIVRIVSSTFSLGEDPVSAQPTAEAVKAAIDRLYVIGDKGNGHVGRRLYLFMAGHGLARGLRDAALLMANAAKNRTGHHVPGAPYADWFRESAFFDEVVLFMDCCLEDNKLSPLQPCHLDPVSGSKPARYYYALAAEFSQPARELPDDNGEMRGVFTAAILAGLRQGPPDGGDVTGAWLEGFAPQYMTRLLGGKDSQTPRFDYERTKDIVFVKRTAASYRVRIHADLTSRSLTIEMCDGTLNVIPPSDRSNGIWEWELGPGIYRYGYTDGPREFLELIAEEREIDVHL